MIHLLISLELVEKDLPTAARVTAALGEEDRTLTMLEQATDAALRNGHPYPVIWNIRCSPEIRGLSGNPRYEAVLDRLGITAAS